jgi:phage replication O-like protein O
MANPQAEDGHIDIAHAIAEAFARYRIPGEEWQCLWVVLRKTYGWKKTEDEISLSQFQEMTGLKRPNVVRGIKGLVSKKILVSINNDTTYATKYRFNKDFDSWQASIKKDTTPKGSIKKDNEVVSKKITPLVSKKIHTKENSTKETPKEIVLPDFISPFTWESFKEYRKKIKKPLTEKAIELTIKKLIAYHAKGHNVNEILETSIVNGWTGIFEPRSNGNSSGPLDAAGRELKYL